MIRYLPPVTITIYIIVYIVVIYYIIYTHLPFCYDLHLLYSIHFLIIDPLYCPTYYFHSLLLFIIYLLLIGLLFGQCGIVVSITLLVYIDTTIHSLLFGTFYIICACIHYPFIVSTYYSHSTVIHYLRYCYYYSPVRLLLHYPPIAITPWP